MIFQPHISFSSRLLAVLTFAGVVHAASVTGQVVLVKSGEPAVKSKHDYSGVVVSLEPLAGGAAAAPKAAPKPVRLDQRNKIFSPHVVAIQTGTEVDFPNSDAITHNVFSNGDSDHFDLHLYDPQTSKSAVFRRPGIAKIFCNRHDEMSAFVVVLDTPYFTVTNRTGAFSIEAPAGRYRLRFWHERSTMGVLEALVQQISAGDSGATLAKVEISEEGYRVMPHKDKWGLDYIDRDRDENTFYIGGRR